MELSVTNDEVADYKKVKDKGYFVEDTVELEASFDGKQSFLKVMNLH